MTDSDYALRPEAGPVRYDSLNRSQRDALTAVVAALYQAVTEAARSKESTKPQGADFTVDTDRVSRLFFVSGEPGSGKSSLYTTLRYITDRTTVGTDRQYQDIRNGYCEVEHITSLEGATRWLEPLDLEVAADEGENLLAAVLVRIFESIDRLSLTTSKECRDAMDRLEELANDIGIAWDGNLRERAGSLDPDSYSQETLRVQQARLSTNRRLRSALSTLLKKKCYGFGESLFVLPIDDFYLKPKASLELLRLLRMISVPQLFFLVMGDIKTVEALFFEKALADWTAVAGPEVLATLQERTKQDVLPRAREMKARYLRKLIPEGQRAIIDWTEWDEALRFQPSGVKDVGDHMQLRHLLSKVRIHWKGGPSPDDHNLLNYLICPRVENDDCRKMAECSLDLPDPKDGKRNAVNKFRESYSGLQILDATPREILDLWMRLRKLDLSEAACEKPVDSKGDSDETSDQNTATVDEPAPRYLRMIVKCAVPAIEEQDFLTEEDQEILRFTFPGSDRDNLQLGTNRLRVAQKLSPWRYSPDNNVFVREHLDWKLGILDAECQDCKRQDGRRERKDFPDKNRLVHECLRKLCGLDYDTSKNCRCESG